MARQGSEYERFAYDKFCSFFPDATVTLDDKILGGQSKRRRQIDVSIKFNVEGQEVLYIVDCKDRGSRPADIEVVDKFSSVVRDVGAAKGFLICTSGFAQTIHVYAASVGIELLTVEDIRSDRWRASIQIPLIYIKKSLNYTIHCDIVMNARLANKAKRNAGRVPGLSIENMMTFSGGANCTSIKEYVQRWMSRAGAFLKDAFDIDLENPGLQVNIAGAWLKCKELRINLTTVRKYYLKYLTPDEYSQVCDHRRNVAVPLNIKIGGPGQLDDSFIEIPTDDLPVAPVISFVLEEWTDLERARGKAPALERNQTGQYRGRGHGRGKNRVRASQGESTTIIPFSTELPGPAFCSLPAPGDVEQQAIDT